MAEYALEFRVVDRSSWDDLVALFESRGGPKYCWCMAWRRQAAEVKHARGATRGAMLKAGLQACVADGVPVGILGYAEGQPIAWCSIAPRPTYRRLGGPEDFVEAPERVWSLVCFFVKRVHRGRGVTERLLEAAVAHARDCGAAVVEAYPVSPDSPSYRYMGLVPAFERAGFTHIGAAGTRRQVMRLVLG